MCVCVCGGGVLTISLFHCLCSVLSGKSYQVFLHMHACILYQNCPSSYSCLLHQQSMITIIIFLEILACSINFFFFLFMQKSMNAPQKMEDASISVMTYRVHITALVEVAGGCQVIVTPAHVCIREQYAQHVRIFMLCTSGKS